MSDCPVLECLFDVRSFVVFVNFYRRFIRGFLSTVQPLTTLTGKWVKFKWSDQCQQAFHRLKRAFTCAQTLVYFDWDREAVAETDASDIVSARGILQHGDDGVLYPVALFSKKYFPAEANYEIYENELMIIVRAFGAWRPELESTEQPIKVLPDHRNFKDFMSNKSISKRQTSWSEFLFCFHFKIVYRQGKQQQKPDTLTCRSEDLEIRNHADYKICEFVLKAHNLKEEVDEKKDTKPYVSMCLLANNSPHQVRKHPNELLQELYNSDLQSTQVVHMLCNRV